MIHESAALFGRERIRVSEKARVDAFCVLSAGPEGIDIGDYVHVGAGSMIFGGGGKVVFEAFSGISPRVCLFSASDDFSADMLINATLPEQFRSVRKGAVTLRKHSSVGCGSVVLPGVTIGWGATVGALSLVREDIPDCAVMAGVPVRLIGQRDRAAIERCEEEFRKTVDSYP